MINIVYASSDSFCGIAGISILSVCKNSKSPKDIAFCMISSGITEENRIRLKKMVEGYGSRIIIIDPPDIEKTAGVRIDTGRWHISTFYRLFLGTILPEEIQKVLYIDCDTIVRRDLAPLWEMDMKGKWMYGVDDCRSAAYRTELGLSENDRYINNGVLLIDLQAWRENGVEKMCADFIRERGGDITYVDQGVQNGVLSGLGKTGCLPPKYNALTILFAFDYDSLMKLRRPPVPMGREEYREAVNSPYIVHFQSCFKMGKRPWMKGCTHPFASEYRLYKDSSPWREDPYMPDDRTLPQKALGAAAGTIPETMMIGFISFLHAKVYPTARQIKQRTKTAREKERDVF